MRAVFWVIVTMLIPVVGYGIMHALVYVLPMGEHTGGAHLALTVLIIFLGLAVPYWMLKAGLFKAHLGNPKEKELQLKDFPKDRVQIAREQN